MMKTVLYLLLLVFITSCSEESDPNGVQIRIENSSKIDFKDVLVNSGSGNIKFGTIKAGKKTDYKKFESAYRYGFVSLIANATEIRHQPYDYVGETPLPMGYYTYKLDLDVSDPVRYKLTLVLVHE
ncbi:hypothetical protein J2X69_004213 [Algoriphagus sp. 4150]|uniref:hypothetical protein n=1 Tax=Algoriphagus sp. 4150 TaxID=2817756 RepID=UPI002859C20E|nr:hypothetical protein [Algoriphagus sp. 4150]MDR7131848.1 hypothetical protein [Algoriphagus sp. 4150]